MHKITLSEYFLFFCIAGTLKVAAKLNYESQSSYTIFIGVKDQYLSAERTEALIVDVIDVNEEPSLTYINAVLNSQEGDVRTFLVTFLIKK